MSVNALIILLILIHYTFLPHPSPRAPSTVMAGGSTASKMNIANEGKLL